MPKYLFRRALRRQVRRKTGYGRRTRRATGIFILFRLLRRLFR